jgi:hypothetical protein
MICIINLSREEIELEVDAVKQPKKPTPPFSFEIGRIRETWWTWEAPEWPALQTNRTRQESPSEPVPLCPRDMVILRGKRGYRQGIEVITLKNKHTGEKSVIAPLKYHGICITNEWCDPGCRAKVARTTIASGATDSGHVEGSRAQAHEATISSSTASPVAAATRTGEATISSSAASPVVAATRTGDENPPMTKGGGASDSDPGEDVTRPSPGEEGLASADPVTEPSGEQTTIFGRKVRTRIRKRTREIPCTNYDALRIWPATHYI